MRVVAFANRDKVWACKKGTLPAPLASLFKGRWRGRPAAPVGFNLPRRWVSTCFMPRRPARLADFPLLRGRQAQIQNTNFQTMAPAFSCCGRRLFALYSGGFTAFSRCAPRHCVRVFFIACARFSNCVRNIKFEKSSVKWFYFARVLCYNSNASVSNRGVRPRGFFIERQKMQNRSGTQRKKCICSARLSRAAAP